MDGQDRDLGALLGAAGKVLLSCLVLIAGGAGCQQSPFSTDARVAAPPSAGGPPQVLDAALASQLVRLSLNCLDREYPNKPGHIVDDPAQVRPHREHTPAFFGCLDWHSAVHGHWAMVRVLRLFPALPEGASLREKLDAHLRPELLQRELAFLNQERNQTFERPYGWGWLLRLRAEIGAWDDPQAQRWRAALDPLAGRVADRLVDYLARLTVPVRDGTHQNTAFALIHALDYARTTRDQRLATAVNRRARDFYQGDRACPTDYEPSGEDFLSPCLTEADLMRRVLPPAEFAVWLDGFLPPLDSPRFRPLLMPVEVRDPKDPRIGHLIGLAWQRSACFDGIAAALPAADPRRGVFLDLAALHRREALRQTFDAGYGGEHWLASFALYALEPN